jgi:cysteine synthase B
MSSILERERASLLDLIGNTPLLRLRTFEREFPGVEIYAKAEWQNPGGSVKDRPAARMIAEGERSGALTHDKVILDATSGNTGIAYAMIGAARGYRVRLCIPDNVTPERKRILRAYDAELVMTSPLEGSDGAIRGARKLYAASSDEYFYPDQYSNDGNWRAHYDTTGPEIIRQIGDRLTHFVAGLGTSGTFVGAGRRLREHARETRRPISLISVQPDTPLHGLEGLKHMASAIVPPIYDATLADENIGAGTETAYEMVRRLARDEGLLVGISSGAALAAAAQVASRLSSGVIVAILPDGGTKYLSEPFWEASTDRGLLVSDEVLDAIRRHGAETYPHECCGALIGRRRRVREAFPLPNTTSEGPRRRFLVRPQDYRAAEGRAAEAREELLGFYHSHPDHPARPSQFDLDHAWPNFSYIIVSVREGVGGAVTSWRLREDRSAFDEERITRTDGPR